MDFHVRLPRIGGDNSQRRRLEVRARGPAADEVEALSGWERLHRFLPIHER
jgi:hypothetical protein